MISMDDQLDYIEKFLNGKLSLNEQRSFEKKLSEDESLREKVENHRILLKGIELGFNRELKSMLKQKDLNEKKLQKNSSAKTRSLSLVIGIAASISIIMTTLYFLLDSSTTPKELVAAYYQSYPNIEAPIDRSDDKPNNAYAFYEQGNFQLALDQFEKMIEINPSDPAPVFYAGICRIELNKTQSALSKFEYIESLDDNKYSRPSLWYQGLCYLKLQEIKKAKDILKELAEGSDVYANNSKEILKQL